MEHIMDSSGDTANYDFCVIATNSEELFAECKHVLSVSGGTVCVTTLAMLDSLLSNTAPAVLVVDINLPGLEGGKRIPEFLQKNPSTPMLVVTSGDDEGTCLELLRSGVSGYCPKQKIASDLAKACRVIQDGEIWAERRIVSRLLREMRSDSGGGGGSPGKAKEIISLLTPREQDITHLVSEGLCQKNIARELDISENTVRNHLRSIFNKAGVSSRLQLALMMKA